MNVVKSIDKTSFFIWSLALCWLSYPIYNANGPLLQLIGKLTHKSSGINTLCTVYLDSNSVRLAAGMIDGPVVVWDPFPPRIKDPAAMMAIPPVVVSKGHEGEVMGMAVVPGMTESGVGKLFTVGRQGYTLHPMSVGQ